MFLFIDGQALLRMGQFSDPVATHPLTNEVEVPPPPPPPGLYLEVHGPSQASAIRQNGILYLLVWSE